MNINKIQFTTVHKEGGVRIRFEGKIGRTWIQGWTQADFYPALSGKMAADQIARNHTIIRRAESVGPSVSAKAQDLIRAEVRSLLLLSVANSDPKR